MRRVIAFLCDNLVIKLKNVFRANSHAKTTALAVVDIYVYTSHMASSQSVIDSLHPKRFIKNLKRYPDILS
jgi:hypothetical protein